MYLYRVVLGALYTVNGASRVLVLASWPRCMVTGVRSRMSMHTTNRAIDIGPIGIY